MEITSKFYKVSYLGRRIGIMAVAHNDPFTMRSMEELYKQNPYLSFDELTDETKIFVGNKSIAELRNEDSQ